MYKRPTSVVTCSNCGCDTIKENRQISFAERRGNKLYCSKKCSGEANAANQFKDVTSFNNLYSVCKTRAKVKQHQFDLDIEYLKHMFFNVQNEKCAITGIRMKLPTRKNSCYDKKDPFSVSIDRIDSAKGYIKGNVHLVLLSINYMKNTFDLCEVLNAIEAIKTGIKE